MNNYCYWKLKKWLTVIGSFLIVFPIGIPLSWSNISMYALSYIAVRGQTKTGVDAPWIVSVFYMCNCCGIFLSGMANRPRTRRIVLCLSVFMFAGGLFLAYFAVQTSVATLTISIGVFCGLTGGVINGMALRYAGEWADEDLGLIICFVQSGSQFWPILVNPSFTIYVNPDNLSPSIEVNSIRMFSQPMVLDKVPSAFIGLGAISFLLHLIGAACIKDYTDNSLEEIQLTNNSTVHPESVFQDRINLGQKENDTTDKDLRQMITSLSFHSISAVYMLFESSIIVLVNYYKEYGAVWIHDDHFLANMGIPFVLCAAIGYSLSGSLSDKIGVKKTLICQLSLSSGLFMLMFFTPMVSRWLYLFNVLLLGFFFSPIFSLTAVSTGILFGKRKHMRNFFLVTLLGILFDFANPPILQALLTAGWFYVFLFSAAVCALSLTIVILTLPRI